MTSSETPSPKPPSLEDLTEGIVLQLCILVERIKILEDIVLSRSEEEPDTRQLSLELESNGNRAD